MRKKTACFGWYGKVVPIWFDRPKPKLVNWPLAKILRRHGDAETGFKVKRFRDFGSEIRLRPWSARVRTWGLRIIFQTLNSKHLPFNAEPCTLDSKPFARNPKSETPKIYSDH